MEKTIAAPTKFLGFWFLTLLGLFVLVFVVSCGPVDKKQASEAVIKKLER